jgi:hypothetical protein
MFATFHAPAPPVGLVEVIAFAVRSTATQSDTAGHEIPVMSFLPPTLTLLHLRAPPAGSLEVRMPPRASAATQSEVVGHDTLVSE